LSDVGGAESRLSGCGAMVEIFQQPADQNAQQVEIELEGHAIDRGLGG
jgi:hypothetical protein